MIKLERTELLPKDKLITQADAARIRGFSRQYVGQLIREGKIPVYKDHLGRKRLRYGDVLDYKGKRDPGRRKDDKIVKTRKRKLQDFQRVYQKFGYVVGDKVLYKNVVEGEVVGATKGRLLVKFLLEKPEGTKEIVTNLDPKDLKPKEKIMIE